jgi:hypothetical protein
LVGSSFAIFTVITVPLVLPFLGLAAVPTVHLRNGGERFEAITLVLSSFRANGGQVMAGVHWAGNGQALRHLAEQRWRGRPGFFRSAFASMNPRGMQGSGRHGWQVVNSTKPVKVDQSSCAAVSGTWEGTPAHLISFFSSFDAQEDPAGGVSRRYLNLGGFAAPLGQQALVLSHAALVVISKQKIPLSPLAGRIL